MNEIHGQLLTAEPLKARRERSSLVQLIRAADQPILAGLIIGTYCACALLKLETSAPFDSLAFLAAAYFFKTPIADKEAAHVPAKPNLPPTP